MARKNRNARKNYRKLNIPRGRHFIYSTTDDSSDDIVVRYLGEQHGDYLTCYHPGGFVLPIHVSQLSNPSKRRKLAA